MKGIKWIMCLGFFVSCLSCSSGRMESPDKEIKASLFIQNGHLYYSVDFHGVQVIGPSVLGLIVDGDTIGKNVTVKQISKKLIDEKYPTRGFHTEAFNYAVEYTYKISSAEKYFFWQARVYNDGFAFRYLLKEKDSVRIKKELTVFKPLGKISVWFFERTNHWKLKSYAGNWRTTRADSLYRISPTGPIQGPVLVYELPKKKFMAITEAALYDYSGMRLKAHPDASLSVNFTEGEKGFSIHGNGITPWRVILLADDLNELVNSDLITNLNPAPRDEWFKNRSWVKPGRAVWSWWAGGIGYLTLESEKHFINRAWELGYEYTLIDDGWERWADKWSKLKHLCEYAHQRNVNVFVWKHSDELNNPDNNYQMMALFLDSLKNAGVSGVKIDFMNGESKALIDFDVKALQLCAERQLMVNFHGCQKPTGEFRTYPNEITREGVRGLELNKMNRHLTSNHNVALVFTRGILNNTDYTPIGFSNPGETSWAHQLATGFAFTSPLLVVAEHPDTLFLNERIRPMLPLLKAMPSVWDETIVLPESSISSLAVLIRRRGNDWYWIALNGNALNTLKINTSFLKSGKWKSYCIKDNLQDAKNVIKEERIIDAGEKWNISIRPNGGAVVQFIQK